MNIYLLLIHLIGSSSSSLLYHASSRSLHFTCTTDGSLSARAPLLLGEWQRGRVPLLPSHLLSRSDFLGTEAGQGRARVVEDGRGVFGSSPVSLTCLKKVTIISGKRALKCLKLLSSGVPFTSLSPWKPHPQQPDNSPRCLAGVQIAAYSLQRPNYPPLQSPCSPVLRLSRFYPSPRLVPRLPLETSC